MSAYVKISYPSEKYNYAMRECIKFIGEHFGRSGRNPYKEGKRIIAKKVRGASRTSINKMVYPKNIRNSKSKEWNFKKRSFDRSYRQIMKLLLKSEFCCQAELLILELMKEDNGELLSEILCPDQIAALYFSINDDKYERDRIYIKRFLYEYEKWDRVVLS